MTPFLFTSLFRCFRIFFIILLRFLCFLKDFEEGGQWCDEKLAVCSATITAKDIRALTSLQQKPKALENEMVRSYNRFLSGFLLKD